MNTLDRRGFMVFGAALVIAGCSTSNSSTTPSVSPVSTGGVPEQMRAAITSVAMVGDSITEASVLDLTVTLSDAGVEDVRIDGKSGRRIAVGTGNAFSPVSGILTVYGLLAEGVDPSVWVIALGTNDVGNYANGDQYGALIDRITALLPAEKQLVWVNTFREQYLDDTVLFNTLLAERMKSRGNAVVADWFRVASAPDQTVLLSDRLHPNDNGRTAFSLLVRQALQEL